LKDVAMDERSVLILGRDEEQGRVERFLAGPRPAMLLVEGRAGIGKTTVWRYGIEAAERAGFHVLAFRSAEAERFLTFGGLAGLFPDRLLDEVLPGIPQARRRALESALLRGEPGGRAVESGVVGLGALSVLNALAERSPVVVGIDDLQWLDDTTSKVLQYALRRVGSAEVVVLAARRTDEGSEPALELALPEDRRTTVRLGPLSVGAIGRLVRERLGLVLARTVAARLHQESDGNPFVALELARAALARGSLPAPGQPFPVSADVASLVGGRISSRSPEAREALLVLAALAHPTQGLLVRAIGSRATAALRELVDADLVRSEGAEIRCAHPLIASVAYARALPEERRQLHHRLARVVEDHEERARHLALGVDGPDDAVAEALDEAAEAARRRGASGAAADLAELAVTLTPPGDRSARARRELVVSERLLDAGSATSARDAALRSVELLPPGPPRVNALIVLARIESGYLGDIATAGRCFRQALDEAGTDRAALVRAHAWAGMDDQQDGSWDARAAHARAVLDLMAGREDEDPDSVASALVTLAEAAFRAGRGLDIGLLDRAVSLEAGTRLPPILMPSVQRLGFLGHAGRHSEAKRGIEARVEESERRGDWSDRVLLLRYLAYLGWCTGDLAEAWGRIEQAEEAAAEVGAGRGLIWALGGRILAAMGRFEEARDWCNKGVMSGKELGQWVWEMHGLASLGFLELTLGDAMEAAKALEAASMVAGIVQVLESGLERTVGDLIEALIGAGRLDEANERTAGLEAEVAASGHPWSAMVAARCRGLLEASAGRTDDALASLDRSLAADTLGEMKLERGRTLLAMGRVRRAANRRRAARETLTEARAVFDACGSRAWAARADADIAGLSGRVASPTELTGAERRVTELAAAGKTNREIAQELFISARTVESHLSSAFRKLGVRTRAGLGPALARLGSS